MEKYTNHSGGCIGSDMVWEDESFLYGVKTIAYSFKGHDQYGKNPKVLTNEELEEGWMNVKIAEKGIKRPLFRIQFNLYIRNLLSRNWFQVKNADAIFAIGKFFNDKRTIVDGGTGWAVQMAIDNRKEIYLFEQNINAWFKYDYQSGRFEQMNCLPTLTEHFAGIGTREINENGINAIKELLKYNLG